MYEEAKQVPSSFHNNHNLMTSSDEEDDYLIGSYPELKNINQLDRGQVETALFKAGMTKDTIAFVTMRYRDIDFRQIIFHRQQKVIGKYKFDSNGKCSKDNYIKTTYANIDNDTFGYAQSLRYVRKLDKDNTGYLTLEQIQAAGNLCEEEMIEWMKKNNKPNLDYEQYINDCLREEKEKK